MGNLQIQASFIDSVEVFLNQAVGIVWGPPLVILLVGAGLSLSIALGIVQIKGFKHAIDVVRGKFDDPNDPGEINHFQALCTALSATIGLGNIAGVAIAISFGGPGAVFWMIVVGLVGMATKFSECSLALMYRHVDEKGEVHGGPMYYIERGLGKAWKPMAVFFAIACLFATFGASNMFQTYEVATLMNSQFQIPNFVTGLVLAVLTGIVIIGGIKRIGSVTSKVVPVMGLIYIVGSLIVILSNASAIPGLLMMIIDGAFNGTAATGGFAGAGVATVITWGVRRACFSNEAGVGSSPIAHSAAATKEPIREGAVALLEPFIDTVVVCTMTALVILISGAWTDAVDPVTGNKLTGALLTAKAFDSAIPGFGKFFVPVAVFLFAYSTLLSWSYYGERALDYLTGGRGIVFYKIVFCVVAFIGAMWTQKVIISFSDLMYGLMVIPNVLAIAILSPKLLKESKSYFQRLKDGEFEVK
ncbi:MAG: sodium:alanine symporter family protein [Bdellovibrionota bacterium]|nr:sodium:alanine symporter family protein [Bdellovibrionota bacterium]